MSPRRIKIIPAIHGKRTRDGKISEADVDWILEASLSLPNTLVPETKRINNLAVLEFAAIEQRLKEQGETQGVGMAETGFQG